MEFTEPVEATIVEGVKIDPADLIWEFAAVRPLRGGPSDSTERHVFSIRAKKSDGTAIFDREVEALGGMELGFGTSNDTTKITWHKMTASATVPGQWYVLIGPDAEIQISGNQYRVIRTAFKPHYLRTVDLYSFG